MADPVEGKANGASADRRETILVAAADVFSRHGYAATRMDDIAERAGIAKGSLYNHFRNKQDLFSAVFARSMSALNEPAMKAIEGTYPAGEKVERLVDHWCSRLSAYQNLARLVLEFWATAARETQSGGLAASYREMYLHWRRRLAAVLAEGVASGEFNDTVNADVAASLIMAVLDGITVQSMWDIGLSVDMEFVASLKRAILAGLRAGKG